MANNYRNYQTNNGRNYQRMTYIEGNAVRRTDAMPDDWENEQKRRREREQRELQERQRARRQRAIARRNQDKALIMNRGYVAFLTMAASSKDGRCKGAGSRYAWHELSQ